MSTLRKITARPAFWICMGVIAASLFFLGDMYYDFVLTPDAATAHCGKGNIESVSMAGFYKRETVCFSDAAFPK